ncbi:MAG: 6-bladed beta-propeller [Phycisphaerales bacterium]|nr:6-bladed beta-propeller [Phycisphaerales bacterium]
MHRTRPGAGRHIPAALRALALAAALGLGACSSPPGMLFEPATDSVAWPPPPDAARVRYLGQLRSADDLHAQRSGLQQFGRAIFGPGRPKGVLISPMGVATDGADRVFVADREAHAVHVYDIGRRRYSSWAPPETRGGSFQPTAIAYTTGRLLVTDSAGGVIHVFTAEGKYLGTLGDKLLGRPVGLAVDPTTGDIYVADAAAHQVVVLSRDDVVLRTIGSRGAGLGEFNFPTFVALDGERRLYVSDSLNFRVQVFAPDGTPLRQIGAKGDMPGYFSQPKGLGVDAGGRLLVVDANFEAIQIFDAAGDLLMALGQEGHGPGEFWLPVGLTIDSKQRIWVADSYNRRVQVFEILQPEEPQP